MQHIINLREANQNLSRYINELSEQDELIITKHGKPVARLLPIQEEETLPLEKQAALKRLRERSKQNWHLGGHGVDRNSLYE